MIGGADTQCGLLGCGCLRPNDIAAVSGTSTPVQMVTALPLVDPAQRLWGGAHVVPGMFIAESIAGESGSIYQWYRETFCGDLVERAKTDRTEPLRGYKCRSRSGTSWLQWCAIFCRGDDHGCQVNEITPQHPGPGHVSSGFSSQSSRPLVTRAILESLAFAVKANTQQVLDVSGQIPTSMGVCGGLANSRLYLELLANTLHLPVHVPEIKEGTAVGAAICAGVGGNVFHSFDEGVGCPRSY